MRILCTILFGVMAFSGCSQKVESLNPQDWEVYKKHFVTAEGRVIDIEQQGVTHSEGQGYGMLLACAYGDPESFQRIWAWSKSNLQIRKDLLFAWRWRASSQGGAIDDLNNASDGDILIAWALCRAGWKWEQPAYLSEARQICRDIRSHLLRSTAYGLVLLPGTEGFEKADGMVLNLSYWIFPAFEALDRCDPSPDWHKLHDSGLALLGAAHFGRYGLPPDWLQAAKTLQPASGFPPVYGYNAIRIPLNLSWSGERRPEIFKPFRDFWNSAPSLASIAATINLSNDQLSPEKISLGVQAICQFAEARSGSSPLHEADLPPLPAGESYFSASLLLLSKVALRDGDL